MRDGTIVQSGKYNELLQSGTDFAALVAAHDSSMELVEHSSQTAQEITPTSTPNNSHNLTPTPKNNATSSNGETKTEVASSRLIKEEERETGHVSLKVYKMYITEAWGWWGPLIVIGTDCCFLNNSLRTSLLTP
jgi:ATP-binding cassette, subfamily C (CFTR/MRP), member 2